MGFMGAGKSSVGPEVARLLGWRFVDSDSEVERRLGQSIQELFASGKEAVFRDMEAQVAVELSGEKELVVALGGGAFERRSTREILLQRCLVVYLDRSWDDLSRTIGEMRASRPLLQNKTMEEIEALYKARQAAYGQAHLRLAFDSRSGPADVALEIVRLMNGVS